MGNSFHLPGSRNVAPLDDFEFYARDTGPNSQIGMCGTYVEIDIPGEAHAIPVEDNSQGYVISSHVFEHLPNPLAAIREMIRVICDGGYIFLIVPLPGALESDKGRPLATYEDWIRADVMEVTVDTWNEVFPAQADVPRRGHYFVYSHDALKELMEDFWHDAGQNLPWLELVASEPVDTKVSNGHTLCYRVHKPVRELLPSEEASGEVEASTVMVSAPAGEPELFIPDSPEEEASKADTEKVVPVKKSRKKS